LEWVSAIEAPADVFFEAAGADADVPRGNHLSL